MKIDHLKTDLVKFFLKLVVIGMREHKTKKRERQKSLLL